MSEQYTHIIDLAKEAIPPEQGILSHTIFQNDDLKAVVFGFGQGDEMSEHTAMKPEESKENQRCQGESKVSRVFDIRLAEALNAWFDQHPGGRRTFCQQNTTEIQPVSVDESNHHFKKTLRDSRWDKLRGWHVLRHSFCSNCAAQGVDQRLINGWVGHQTEEMVRRYRHLIPGQQQEAIRAVFGDVA